MKPLEQLVRFLRVAAVLSLAAMTLITIVDVTMRNTINELVLGGVELVQLTLVLSVFLALPDTFLRNEHITIDLIDQFAPPRVVTVLRCIGALLTFVLLAVIAWRMFLPALDTIDIGDRTSDLQIPLIWYWLPLLIGAVTSVLAQGLVVIRELGSPAGNG
ncbi:MAG TPA: TRAP transporter small permease [Gammaproteobacteria bacterium]|nr:TRAP transporter small permease [Gammaproteobacteria bacterium]